MVAEEAAEDKEEADESKSIAMADAALKLIEQARSVGINDATIEQAIKMPTEIRKKIANSVAPGVAIADEDLPVFLLGALSVKKVVDVSSSLVTDTSGPPIAGMPLSEFVNGIPANGVQNHSPANPLAGFDRGLFEAKK